ncbi:VOC family protein [Conexibacter arvalis]|uniref:Catechol 2,3-dioxygenase-like lactoylglutathione lyase family enzyme n=1 Tax=Conexibacter arvalis TaxID=912552 RepID=A0A840I7L2_9ACTN|nr:VOC family protein [Conexibacter arvalis]MBB4660502.1 catechol 2,3-dioxygenase-like lactoylglutathione lyase family enzyme [Conexibacter arvalis]
MHFTGLDHVGFTVSDLDRSIAWYGELLGTEPTVRKIWERPYLGRIVGYPGCRIDVAVLPLPGTFLELIQYLDPPPQTGSMETFTVGNGHLCLITEDLAADYARLRGRAEFRSPEPVRVEWGPYEGGYICYLRDPDGITVELVQLPPGGPAFAEAAA